MNNSLSAGLQQNNLEHIQQIHHSSNSLAGAHTFQQPPQTAAAVTFLQQDFPNEMNPHKVGITNSRSVNTQVFDAHHMKIAKRFEKPLYSVATSVGRNSISNTTTEKFYTFSDGQRAAVQTSTVMLPNNFSQQQLQQACPIISTVSSVNVANNLRFIPTTNATIQQPTPTEQRSYKMNNNICKDAQSSVLHLAQLSEAQQAQFIPQHQLLQQRNYTQHQHLPRLLQPNSQITEHTMQLQLPSAQQFYLPTDSTMQSTTKMVPSITPDALVNVPAPIELSNVTTASTPTTNNSTVVLDRINICINNHYADAAVGTSPATALLTSSTSSNEQQPSPIIPLIQHKTIIDSPCNAFINSCSNSESNLVIDEPDSTTTTPNTPPTTPENSSPTSSSDVQSSDETKTKLFKRGNSDAKLDERIIIEESIIQSSCNFKEFQATQSDDKFISQSTESPNHTPLTPPTPTKTFAIGEDVFIKRQDDRFYLGTIIDTARQQFLVRFDDKSEVWCESEEMRKLGGQSETKKDQGQMCVVCKRSQRDDIVEICERCGRGYHRQCTVENTPGLGDWLCKRCRKPMKVLHSTRTELGENEVCRQLPYHANKLHWDKNHRVNEEQIYCYCGKYGRFDQNMIQCCFCRNWFHTSCMQDFKHNILRGDAFFIFCCSVCNDGEEFLRRLQINWVDLMHLTLYNLSSMKKHQHTKYHHLHKDIMPFILEKLNIFPIRKEWKMMSENEIIEKIYNTLRENNDRFICGRETKREVNFFALRNNGPPTVPRISIQSVKHLNDEFLIKNLNLPIVKALSENSFLKRQKTNKYPMNISGEEYSNSKQSRRTGHKDVYEFRVDDDTSDDEIPIKHMIDNIRKSKIVNNQDESQDVDIEGCDIDSAIEALAKIKGKGEDRQILKKESKITFGGLKDIKSNNRDAILDEVSVEKSSRKRKAFTFSKSYKEFTAETGIKRYDNCRIGDSSSDENSSSSRGTSLDVIIPPPKNFLGPNNPFRMVTPKKNGDCNGKKTMNFGRGSNVVKRSIFNTSALDLGAKLAALKSAGIIPNVNTSHLAKAAGQPRTVRTIKRRLSAKDIMIGPNQEIRRRRIRRLSSNIEVISTTTINTIPSQLFQGHAKDLKQSTSSKVNQHNFKRSSSVSSSSPPTSTTSSVDSMRRNQIDDTSSQSILKPTHGRRLRQRPQKRSPSVSRRSSISSGSTSSIQSNSSSGVCTVQTTPLKPTIGDTTMHDLKESLNKYFGAANRFESGEPFTVVAKRTLNNGEVQYLIEWGDPEMQNITIH